MDDLVNKSGDLVKDLVNDCISRQAAIETVRKAQSIGQAHRMLMQLPSTQPGQRNTRVFQGIIVEYPSISTYPEYEGKPYFSIEYTVNGQKFIGYSTYKPEVLSEYLKKYFMPPTQSKHLRGRNINVDEFIKFLNPESNYVFYDDAHGFCINTQDVLDHLCAMPSAQPSVSKEEMVGDAVSRQGVLRLLNAVPSEEFATKAMLISGVNALPSAQPECEDAVSRKWLIETVEEGWIKFDTEKDYNRYIHLVRDIAPSVAPKQPGWIPCSERLPQNNVAVLVTTVFGFVTVGERINRDHELWFLHDSIPATDDDVVAWMPLPTPCREGGQDES